jgi:acetyltransferase-like isoleucine patch superfamily enzyme
MESGKVLVLGMGEIGSAVHEVIRKNLNREKWVICTKDIGPFNDHVPETIDVMHVCIPFVQKNFISCVNRYQEKFSIPLVIIHSTVLPGTTRQCMNAVHVPIRGRHPDIVRGINSYELFVGMDNSEYSMFSEKGYYIPAEYLTKAFNIVVNVCHPPETTELAKILDLSHYAVNLEFSRLISKCAKELNVSVTDLKKFTSTRNETLSILEDHDRLNLPILDPLSENQVIGGHCVLPAVNLLNQVCPDMMLGNIIFNNAEAAKKRAEKEKVQETNKVWEPCNIYPSAKMGENNSIGMFTEIGENVIIGDRCRIGAHCYIPSGILIGNDCFLGPRVTFTNDKHPPSGKELWEKTIVMDNVSIGAGAVILPGIVLGEKSKIGAGSVVTKDVLPKTTVYGNPATEHEVTKEV